MWLKESMAMQLGLATCAMICQGLDVASARPPDTNSSISTRINVCNGLVRSHAADGSTSSVLSSLKTRERVGCLQA